MPTQRYKRAGSNAKAPSEVVTLGMVAQAAGVSPSTVSRILNGTSAVHEAKRAAVEAAVQRLGALISGLPTLDGFPFVGDLFPAVGDPAALEWFGAATVQQF